jgi:hypothetical protein
VVLNSQPTADVVIPVASSDPTEGTVSASSLTFTAADWNVPQSVTVTGVDDRRRRRHRVRHHAGAPASADPNYAAIDPADVASRTPTTMRPGISVTPVAGLGTTEAGGTRASRGAREPADRRTW